MHTEWILWALALILLAKGAWAVACPAQVCRILTAWAAWSDGRLRILGGVETVVGLGLLLLVWRT